MKTPVERVVGSLKVNTIDGRSGGPCVVMFHGYGADASDLVPLYDLMDLGPQLSWYFPDGPLEVIIGPGIYGRCWYPIDMARLERGMMSGEPADLSQIDPDGLPRARKLAGELFREVRKKHSQVFLGGFSQGAMLALDTALTEQQKPDALILMSGSLLAEKRWREAAGSCSGIPFIQTHGKNDVLLGYEYAERLFEMLNEAGLHGEFIGFSGGHEIPPQAIKKIAQFIRGSCKPLQ